MLVKSSNVRVLTGGLQKAYVSMMASRPVLTREQEGLFQTHTLVELKCVDQMTRTLGEGGVWTPMPEAEILILTPVLKWVLISKFIACF